MKTLFSILFAALFLTAGFAEQANARCVDKYGHMVTPVTIADAAGNVLVSTPTGTPLYLSGLPPFAEVCSNLLFTSAAAQCRSGYARLEASRAPKYCAKGAASGEKGCWHVQCIGP